ncbi:MAG: tetraacyldisaccharide 4'-kinase [Geminicoccaceae bacterium]
MRAPDFWQHDGLLARLLDPLGKIYGLIGKTRRRLANAEAAPIPVICIGNLTVGGAGKTPTAIAIADHLKAGGERPHLLTRGYGGRLGGPVLVDPDRHEAGDVGDEALLLAEVAPTWVSRDRVAGAAAAAAAGASLVIMDDGLQNPYLAHDLALVVVDGQQGFGNGRLMPAGPLRESVAPGLARVQGLIRIGPDQACIAGYLPSDLPVLEAELRPAANCPDLKGQRVLAFAGIGRPEKFYKTLRDLGANLVATSSFADHYPYKAADIERLLAQARQVDACCITTEKDYVKIPLTLRNNVKKVPIMLNFKAPDILDGLLSRRL